MRSLRNLKGTSYTYAHHLDCLIDRGSLESNSTSSHIPFRDSKLTRLLQPALSGKSRVAIICTISPDAEQATETLSTLKFAKRAKLVVTKAERNVLVSDRMMLQNYATEVEKLKRLIAAGENAVADGEMARERDSARAQVGELTTQKDLVSLFSTFPFIWFL